MDIMCLQTHTSTIAHKHIQNVKEFFAKWNFFCKFCYEHIADDWMKERPWKVTPSRTAWKESPKPWRINAT
jgi:hypothetical protein